jgi:hypothetical protein
MISTGPTRKPVAIPTQNCESNNSAISHACAMVRKLYPVFAKIAAVQRAEKFPERTSVIDGDRLTTDTILFAYVGDDAKRTQPSTTLIIVLQARTKLSNSEPCSVRSQSNWIMNKSNWYDAPHQRRFLQNSN